MITHTDDAREALEILLSRPIDLLWVVVAQGDRESVLLLEELRREYLLERLPVVVLLERSDPELVRTLNACGVRRIFPLGGPEDLQTRAIFEEIADRQEVRR